MTKTKMRNYLRYQLEQLDRTKDGEKFYARTGELFYRLRQLPNKENAQEHFNKMMDIWEEHFYVYAQCVEFNQKMRLSSMNKKYQKPSLGIRFKKNAYDMIKLHIDWSLLPKK